MNSIDAILNFAWALLCIGALGWHFWRDRQAGARKQAICSRRTLSVILAAVSLFPCISATDDRVRLADIDGNAPQQAAFDQSPAHSLPMSLQLEDPEHGQTAAPFLLAFIVCFFLLALLEARSLARWFSYSSLGRAPPTAAVA